eukprot:5233039-Prymnesium_polylepis.1
MRAARLLAYMGHAATEHQAKVERAKIKRQTSWKQVCVLNRAALPRPASSVSHCAPVYSWSRPPQCGAPHASRLRAVAGQASGQHGLQICRGR